MVAMCVPLLTQVCHLMSGSAQVSPWFNESILALIPKGVEENDGQGDQLGLWRCPSSTSPIQLSNTDSKLMAMLCDLMLAPLAAQSCGPAQRGMTSGRILHDNIVTLGVHMEGFLGRPGATAGYVLLDQETAFTSIEHDYLRDVLRRARAPRAALHVLRVLYQDNSAQIFVGHTGGPIIPISMGIKQGCPTSGSLWAIAFEPVLRRLQHLLGKDTPYALGAFADDVGLAVEHLRLGLALLLGLRESLRQGAGLRLNIRKTHIVPMNAEERANLAGLQEDMGSPWREAQTPSAGLYLGFRLGGRD